MLQSQYDDVLVYFLQGDYIDMVNVVFFVKVVQVVEQFNRVSGSFVGGDNFGGDVFVEVDGDIFVLVRGLERRDGFGLYVFWGSDVGVFEYVGFV